MSQKTQAAVPKIVKNSGPRKPDVLRKPKSSIQGKRCLHLEITAPPGAEVFVAGDFNDWEHTQHRLTDKGNPGLFRRNIYVTPGRYEYKFNIDGEWQIDPNCQAWSPNEFGSLNSVAHIG